LKKFVITAILFIISWELNAQVALPTFQGVQKPPPLITSCEEYLAANSGSSDGLYNIDIDEDGTNETVYCDMTAGGYTIENAGFGDHEETYSGWYMLKSSEYTAAVAGAVAYFYNENGGFINLGSSWNSGNCCIISGSDNNSYYSFDGGNYMYPANTSGVTKCNSGYSDSYYKLTKSSPSTLHFSTLTQSQVQNIGTSNSCSDNGNPAIFIKRSL